jgi:ABC-type glycerol-3-phosphate transport system substrate-binding protein
LFAAGLENDVMMCDGSGVFDYSLEDGSSKAILKLLDYDILIAELSDVKIRENGDVICVLKDNPWLSVREIIRLRPVDPDNPDMGITEKKTVTLAAIGSESWLSLLITDFNKQSEAYRVETKFYAQDSEQSDAFAQFNLDLISGDIPDIILTWAWSYEYYLPVQSYIDKGLLADLNEIMDNDPGFNREDYLQSALNAYEREDGKLYEVFPMFDVFTYAAKASDVGNFQNWTLDEFEELLISRPDVRYPIGALTQKDFIMQTAINLFIDPITGKCGFDRDRFDQIIRISKRFPFEPPENSSELAFGARDGDPLMVIYNLKGMYDIKMAEEAYFGGEEAVFPGWPGPSEKGSDIRPVGTLAITENAKERDGAWQFIKYTLDAEYPEQSMSFLYSLFPVRLTEIDKLAERAAAGVDGSFTINSVSVDFPPNTAEDNKKVMSFLESIGRVSHYPDEVMYNIMNEEIEAYFAGQKSADDVADIIENRINLYISEME